jgi:hypothetical protein
MAYTVQEFWAKNNMAVVPHPSHSPDVAPAAFFLFLKMKIKMKGRRLGTVEEIQVELQMVINTLTKNTWRMHFKSCRNTGTMCTLPRGLL